MRCGISAVYIDGNQQQALSYDNFMQTLLIYSDAECLTSFLHGNLH